MKSVSSHSRKKKKMNIKPTSKTGMVALVCDCSWEAEAGGKSQVSDQPTPHRKSLPLWTQWQASVIPALRKQKYEEHKTLKVGLEHTSENNNQKKNN